MWCVARGANNRSAGVFGKSILLDTRLLAYLWSLVIRFFVCLPGAVDEPLQLVRLVEAEMVGDGRFGVVRFLEETRQFAVHHLQHGLGRRESRL